MNFLLIFIGGGLGSLARYGISLVVKNNYQTNLPVSTFLSNVISCFLLALTVYFFQSKYILSNNLKLLIITGVCGGFSTFSAFSYETFELFKFGYAWLAVANILISLISCLGIMYFFSNLSN
jgi:CrcB protein